MSIHNEIQFEDDICDHLAASEWLYSPNDTGYNRELALFPEDAIGWIRETQPAAWQRLEAFCGGATEAEFLNRLVKVLTTDGTLRVLRNGFKAVGAGAAGFQMVQFKPSFGFNQDIADRYNKVRLLRVMRQVHYSVSNQNCIDLVLFVNGIPVATIDVKTEVYAVKQQMDRDPRDWTDMGRMEADLVHSAS